MDNDIEEQGKCLANFYHFLTKVKIVETAGMGKPGGIIDFQLWPHLMEIAAYLLSKRLIVMIKSKQIGASYILAAYVVWFAISHQGANILLFSIGEEAAKELLIKCKRIYHNLPDYLKLKLGSESLTEMTFPAMDSRIKAFPSTETAGIGENASVVIADEWCFHPYADQNFTATRSTISGSGQFIGVSTVDPFNANTLCQATYEAAVAGEMDFVPLFYGYYVRPDRNEATYEWEKRNIPKRELALLTPELHMLKNFPRTIDEALRPISTMSAFNNDALNRMKELCRPPIYAESLDPGVINIFQDFYVGEPYIAATDTGHGIGQDYSITTIMNVKTGAIVADIMQNRMREDQFALYTHRLLLHYNSPLWFPEDNDWGRVVITKCKELGYKNFGYRDAKRTKEGFHTAEDTRTDLFGALIPAIDNNLITIFNENGLNQFYGTLRHVDKYGKMKIEAIGGKHDDYVIAVGICWLKRNEVQIGQISYKPIRTLTFRR